MANRIKNIDSIQTSSGTIVDLENIQAAGGGGNTFKDLDIQGSATATSQDSVEYTVTGTTVLSGIKIVKFHVTMNGGSTVTVENGVTTGFVSAGTGSCPVTVPFNAAAGINFVISATAEDELGNVSKEFTKTVNLIANEKPTAPTAATFVKMSPSSLKNTQTVTFSGSTDAAGVGGSVVSYRVKNISDSVLSVDAADVAAGSAHTFRLASDADVTQYWTDNSLTNSKNATFDVVAVDNLGLESDPTQMQIEIDKNRAPTAPSTQAINDLSAEESITVTFAGAVDADGQVASYKVSNISDPCLTVAHSIVNAGDPHQFTVGIQSVVDNFLNGDIGPKDVTFDVSAIDDLGLEGPVTAMAIGVAEPPTGEVVYTSPGTYSWTAPTGVTSVCAVCVGGGGGSSFNGGGNGGGAGGGLGWKNNISVVPGITYNVKVGQGGEPNRQDGTPTPGGEQSFFISNSEVSGSGGDTAVRNIDSSGGGFTGDGGGNGGSSKTWGAGGGGGGAGGYSGSGGQFAAGAGGYSGQGGGGGAGGSGAHNMGSGGGGGVGLFGQGADGFSSGVPGTSGNGGSGGANGALASAHGCGAGGSYGGGSSGSYYGGSSTTLPGANGAVRIIWGPGRSFPNNAA